MVQSLPGFLNLCLNVCSPSQVLQSQSEEFRPRSVSLEASLMGTIVLNAEL